MSDQNSEYQILTEASQQLAPEYEKDMRAWQGSPFAWIKSRPSRQIDAIGEKLISCWLGTHGFSVFPSGDTDADRVVDGVRTEIKFSTLWQNGSYVFQQLRDQNYAQVICLGVSPHAAHCWVLPKADVMRLWREGTITSQHGGKKASETAWLPICPNAIPEWLAPYGGSLEQALAILRNERN